MINVGAALVHNTCTTAPSVLCSTSAMTLMALSIKRQTTNAADHAPGAGRKQTQGYDPATSPHHARLAGNARPSTWASRVNTVNASMTVGGLYLVWLLPLRFMLQSNSISTREVYLRISIIGYLGLVCCAFMIDLCASPSGGRRTSVASVICTTSGVPSDSLCRQGCFAHA